MKSENLIWGIVSVVIVYLVWLVVKPLISPIVIGLALVYITYPAHHKLSRKVGERYSALALTMLLAMLSFLFVLGFVLWVNDVKYQIVRYLETFFNWLQSATLSSPRINEVASSITEGISTRIEAYVISYTYSIPKLTLEVFAMLFIYYGALVNAEKIRKEVFSLIPHGRRELGLRLLRAGEETLDTLLKSWLALSTLKGTSAALGFWVFGIANPTGAIALGILTMFVELLPLIGGWMVWIPGVVYLVRDSSYLAAFLFALYSGALISPLPDFLLAPKMTLRRRGLNALISLLGIFGGLWAFGLMGIIVGPVSLGLLVTLVEEWRTLS